MNPTNITSLSEEKKKLFQSNLDTGMAPINAVPSTINAEALSGSAKPLNIPVVPPYVSPTPALAASAQAGVDADKEAEAFAREQMKEVNQIQSQKQGLLEKLGLRNSQTEGLYADAIKAEEATVAPAQAELKDIRTKEADTIVQYRAESDAIKARGDITKEGQQSLQSNADDNYGRKLADLAIRKSAAIANVADLRTAIDRKLQFQLAPIEREQKFFKDFLVDNFDELTKNEKDRINLQISERDKLKKEITDKENTAKTALETALKNGVKIPDAVVQEIQQNPGQAYEIFAANGISLQDPLDRQYKQEQILTSQANRAKTVAETAGKLIPKLDANGNVIRDAQGNPIMVTNNGSGSLINLITQYKDVLTGSSFLERRFGPDTTTMLNSLKGQITAEYKQAEKLGTLDVGVQKLIDSIIPAAGGLSIGSLSKEAQIKAIDNFIANQGGGLGTTTPESLRAKYNY